MSEFHEAPKNPTPEKSSISLDVHISSQPSEKHPKENEDYYFFNHKNGSFGLFDGAGGMASGKESSRFCADLVSVELSLIDPKKPLNEIALELGRITQTVNQSFLDNKENFRLGGSTGIFGLFSFDEQGNNKVIIANIGDSRAYLAHGGLLDKLTIDDGAVRETSTNYFEIQDHLDEADSLNDLNDNEKDFFRSRNQISQFFGFQSEVIPRIIGYDVNPGDILLLTSDGIHDNLTTTEIRNIIFSNKIKNSKDISESLIEASATRSAEKSFRSKADDMTAMVIKINNP